VLIAISYLKALGIVPFALKIRDNAKDSLNACGIITKLIPYGGVTQPRKLNHSSSS